MDIEYLKEFLLLAEVGSYVVASDRLFISQASLSRHIKGMEKELGLPLFHRNSRRVELSIYGQRMIPYARSIVETEQRSREELERTRKAANGSIVVGALHTMAGYDIARLLAMFTTEHPNTQIDLVDDFNASLRECVRQGTCDFAFIRETGSESDTDFEKVNYDLDTLVAVLPAGHPLSGSASLRLEQLRDESFILLPKQTQMHGITMDICRRAGFEPRVNLSGTNGQGIFDMVGSGSYVSLMMKKPALAMKTADTAVVDVIPTFTSQINLIYRSENLTVAGRNFLKFVRSWQKTAAD